MARKSGITRKLQDFGWLWAVKGNDPFDPEWPAMTIKIRFATTALFDQDITDSKIWAYGTDQDGVPILRHASFGWDDRLGSAALSAALSGLRGSPSVIEERVEYIALKSRDDRRITVFRPPKGMTMWQFLQEYHPDKNWE